MRQNQLKVQGVTYEDFLRAMTERWPVKVMLARGGAISAVQYGFGRSAGVWFFVLLLYASLIGAVISIFLAPWYMFFIGVGLAIFSFKMSRRIMMGTVWYELTGKGIAPFEQRKSVYDVMVKHDILWSDKWESPNDPLGLFSGNPIGNAINNLMDRYAKAAAQGKRIVNRIPESVRTNMLKGEILKRLNQMERSTLDDKVWNKIKRVNLSGPLGEIGKLFDEIQPEIPNNVLGPLEFECRKEDEKNFKDLPMLTKPEVVLSFTS